MPEFSMKLKDTKPSITATLYDENDVACNLTGCTIKLLLENTNTKDKLSFNCTILNAVGGIVTYNWASTDISIWGIYNAEFEVTYNTGAVRTVPNSSYFIINVHKDLNS